MAANPPTVVQLPADYTTDRLGQLPVAIVIHATGGTDSRSTLQHGDGRGVSIHALIVKPGAIYRMVPDERGANHAGAASSSFRIGVRTYSGGAVNRATLGIELENTQSGHDPYPDIQLLSMGWQIIQWRAKFGPLPILRHADIDPTRRKDPMGLTVAQIEQWANAATLVYDTDPFAAWGDIGKPTGAAVEFAVPKAWLVNKVLGACVQGETYATSGKYSITEFTHGLILYYAGRNATQVVLF